MPVKPGLPYPRDGLLLAAVWNNAAWCDAVCRSLGLETRWDGGWWRCLDRPPPFFPDAVSLAQGAGPPEFECRAVKDSFQDLPLRDAGYSQLFEAAWYGCRGPECGGADGVKPAVRPRELDLWLERWGGTPEGAVIFAPDLLQGGCVDFLLSADGRSGLVSFAETCRGIGTVGITNLFGGSAGIADCLAWINRLYPEDFLCGYGNEAELALLQPMGFETLGPLAVWLRE